MIGQSRRPTLTMPALVAPPPPAVPVRLLPGEHILALPASVRRPR